MMYVCARTYMYLIDIIRNVIYLIKMVSNCNRIRPIGNVFETVSDWDYVRFRLCSIDTVLSNQNCFRSKLYRRIETVCQIEIVSGWILYLLEKYYRILLIMYMSEVIHDQNVIFILCKYY